MKIVVAPDSFKGSLTAAEVAEHIERGILTVLPDAEIIKVPMADGGEGTAQALVNATGGEMIYKEVTGPLGNRVRACFGLLGNGRSAVIEMATASGIELIPPDKLDPMKTTTYGTGELIKAALDRGIKELVIGIGGSATVDAGAGMAQALGASFKDERGNEVAFGGGKLKEIKKIDLANFDERIKETEVKVACDVNNILYGPDGAAFVYGPQKGATPEMVKLLDDNLRYFSKLVKEQLGIDLTVIKGGGAAGGLGAGLVAFLDAALVPGVELVLKANNFEEKLDAADLIITGEGKIDIQTVKGKTPIGVAKKAKERNIPVVALAGVVDDSADEVYDCGIDSVFSIVQRPVDLNEAYKKSGEWLARTTEQIIRLYKIAK